ncbi:MAG: TetR/AcrR family transcriptional regulator [Nitrospirae bacterium]|nr:MAG: TetR/AcrR family transcriptional regulator [Nitrospirota bacterium]
MAIKTRDKILNAGLKLISTRGYLGATTKEIARAAGVAELTVFRHFESKEKLFEAVLTRYTFLPVLKEMIPEIAGMPYEKALREIAGRQLQVLSLRRDMVKIMHAEMGRYPEKVQEIYHSFIDQLIKVLAAYFDGLIKKGLLREFDAELGARAFFGMFFSYFNAQEFLMRKKHRTTDQDKVVSEFVKIFVQGTLIPGAEETEAV